MAFSSRKLSSVISWWFSSLHFAYSFFLELLLFGCWIFQVDFFPHVAMSSNIRDYYILIAYNKAQGNNSFMVSESLNHIMWRTWRQCVSLWSNSDMWEIWYNGRSSGLKAEKYIPASALPLTSLRIMVDCMQRWWPTIPSTYVNTCHSVCKEVEFISPSFESGLYDLLWPME